MTRRNWSTPWHPQHHACSNGGCIDHNGAWVPPTVDDVVPSSGEWAQGADGRWHPTDPESSAPKSAEAQERGAAALRRESERIFSDRWVR